MPDPTVATEFVASSIPFIITFAVGAAAGAMAPTYYAQERLRGFGRALFRKVPYDPPPGMKREEAMRAAAQAVDENDGAADQKDGAN